MKFLLYLFLGYVRICIPTDNMRAVLNIANSNSVKILKVEYDECVTTVYLARSCEKAFCRFLAERQIEYAVDGRLGIPFVWQRYKHRAGLICGIVMFLAVINIAPMFIWEINVTGLDRLSRGYVCGLLEEQGVKIGAFSPIIDRQKVFTGVLKSTDEISWISVNIRGSSANVEVLERDTVPISKARADGANIIASRDGQITGAEIVHGRAVVKSGDIVRKGTLLVSGVIDTKAQNTLFVYSEASVYATVYDEFEIEIPLECVTREYCGEEIAEMSVQIFGKSINIFKNYSISYDNYDTIYRENNLSFWGLDRLPFSVQSTRLVPYTETTVILDESKALAAAKEECKRRISGKDTYAEILSKTESYEICNDVLIYRCGVEAIENIAVVSEFEVNLNDGKDNNGA